VFVVAVSVSVAGPDLVMLKFPVILPT